MVAVNPSELKSATFFDLPPRDTEDWRLAMESYRCDGWPHSGVIPAELRLRSFGNTVNRAWSSPSRRKLDIYVPAALRLRDQEFAPTGGFRLCQKMDAVAAKLETILSEDNN